MSRVTQNFWNIKSNAFLRVLVAFVFVFSMSSVAGASPNSAHQMPQMPQMFQVQTITHSGMAHSGMQIEAAPQDCDQIAMHDSCCEDSDDMPCSDIDGCKSVCSGYSLSSAVLGAAHDLRYFSKSYGLAFSQASYDETNPQSYAPPPRT